jgi:hypothetical protein
MTTLTVNTTINGGGSVLNEGPGPGNQGAVLVVGDRGLGNLTVSNNGQVNVTGPDATLILSRGDDIAAPTIPPVNSLPQGTMVIQSGADVNVTAVGGSGNGTVGFGSSVIVGDRYNANGHMTVTGEGSTLNISADMLGNSQRGSAALVVGADGDGVVVATAGADITVNGADDGRASIVIGAGQNWTRDSSQTPYQGALPRTPSGHLFVSGAGTTVTLNSDNTAANAGTAVLVGAFDGASGQLTVTGGAQFLNDVGSLNSVMEIGGHERTFVNPVTDRATGFVWADGVGSLIDAGALAVVGGNWSRVGADPIADFNSAGGSGKLAVTAGAIFRADTTVVGSGGFLTGDSVIDGDVLMNGSAGRGDGIIDPGQTSLGQVGRLTITGDLSGQTGTAIFDINGLTAGTQYDQIKVNGAADLGWINVLLNFNTALNAGDRFVLIDSDTSFDWSAPFVDLVTTGLAANQGYVLADAGDQFIFEALNSNGVGPSILRLGSSSTNGAIVRDQIDHLGQWSVTGSGGEFERFAVTPVSAIEGTAGSDNMMLGNPNGASLFGLGGNDLLRGRIVDGGSGNDFLMGLTMTGGAGNDWFYGAGAITDYAPGDIVFLSTGLPVVFSVSGTDVSVSAFGSSGNGVVLTGAASGDVTVVTRPESLGDIQNIASNFQTLVAQGHTAFQGSGDYSLVRFDADDNQTWRIQSQLYNSAGQLFATSDELDSGGLVITKYDLAGTNLTYERIGYNSNTALSYRHFRYDDGSRLNITYDDGTLGSLNYSIDEINTAGVLRIRTDVFDNGSFTASNFTPSGAAWYSRDFMTDGSRTQTNYDLGSNPWSSYKTYKNAAGQVTRETTLFDNGTRTDATYDVAGANWYEISKTYDIAGRNTFQSTKYDDGSRQYLFYDYSGANWYQIEQVFDTMGRKDTERYQFDDNSYTVTDIDQADAFSWTYHVTHYNNFGVLVSDIYV